MLKKWMKLSLILVAVAVGLPVSAAAWVVLALIDF